MNGFEDNYFRSVGFECWVGNLTEIETYAKLSMVEIDHFFIVHRNYASLTFLWDLGVIYGHNEVYYLLFGK